MGRPNFFIVLIFIAILSLLAACASDSIEKPDLDISNPDIDIVDNTDIAIGDWTMDPTGTFSYISVNPRGRFDMFFEEGMVFHDNMFIYEVYDSSPEPVKMYGYMDTGFNKLTGPISLEPNVFMYGLTRIATDEGSYILGKDSQVVKEYYPGYTFIEDTLIKVDWGKKIYYEPFMVSGTDLESYPVPYKVEPGPGNSLGSPVYGFIKVQDIISGNEPKEEDFIIPAVYQDVELFYDGTAAVKANDKWGLIDLEGNQIVECKYGKVVNLTHGVAALYEELDYENLQFGTWLLIDSSGNELIPGSLLAMPEESQPNKFVDNLSFFGVGNYKLFTSEGETLTGWLDYREEGPPLFREEYIVIYQTGGKYFFDKTGSLASPIKFYDARNFSDGLAAVYNNKTKKWGFINKAWERIIPYTYSRVTDFSMGYAYASIDQDGFSMTNDPGFIIDKHQNAYLKDLNLISMTQFNEDGYALAYAIETNEYRVNKNAGMSKSIQAEYITETRDDKVYYIIHIEQP